MEILSNLGHSCIQSKWHARLQYDVSSLLLWCVVCPGLVPPVFTGPSRISITSGEEVTGQVQASSPGGSQLSFSVIDPAPIGFEFTSDSGHFRWKLQPNAPVAELNLVAKSADGANSVLTPTVFVCDCSHNGTCDFNQITSKQGSSVKTARCLCPSAYDGEHCESDRDGCAAAFQPCFSGVPCIDRIAPLSGYICGGCPAGFSGSGDFCFGKFYGIAKKIHVTLEFFLIIWKTCHMLVVGMNAPAM